MLTCSVRPYVSALADLFCPTYRLQSTKKCELAVACGAHEDCATQLILATL